MNRHIGIIRIVAAMLSLCLSWCCASALAEDIEPIPYPEALRVSIVREEWKADDNRTCQVALPNTCLDAVDQQLRSAQEVLWQDMLAHSSEDDVLELEATYRVSGDRWVGFLLTGRVMMLTNDTTLSYEVETTTYLCYHCVTFDMTTGQQLTLGDVFPEDSPVWEEIAARHYQRLLAYYPHLMKDLNNIEAQCSIEALKTQSFLPSAGRMTIVAPLWSIHEAQWQLVHTILPYPDFRQWMTENAYVQTDNSQRPIIALTYDDGPARVQTEKVIRSLGDYGANATFFCLGRSVAMWPDIVRRQLDYGHTVGSHTYKHKYDFQVTSDYLREDRLQCLQIHRELTGLAPELFRAPGGNCDKYLSSAIGWPIILWRFSAGDTGNNNAYQIADRIVRYAKNGDIILMHDIHKKTAKGSEMFLSQLAEMGFMFATVDELLYLHGIVPQPNTIYYDAFTPPATEP